MTGTGAPTPSRVALAGSAYFALLLLAGFILGAVRTLLIAPRTGPLVAVAIEVPFMIGWAAFVSKRIAKRWRIERAGEALAFGLFALLLLILAEFALAAGLAGLAPSAYAASIATPSGTLGLAGQILAGLLPFIRALGRSLNSRDRLC